MKTKRLPPGKILKKGFVFGTLLIFATYGLSNLFLMSPKGRSIIGSKISRKCGLPASVEGASWSPWNGISFYGIRIEQPVTLQPEFEKPLLQIESIRVAPAWLELKNRRLAINSVWIEKPKFLVPIEILSHLSKGEPEQRKAEPPLLATNESKEKPSETSGRPTKPSEPPEIRSNQHPKQSPVSQPSGIPSLPKPDLLTTWVHVSGASFKLFSSFSDKPLYAISGAGGSIPLGGNPTESVFTLPSVHCADTLIGENMSIPIHWQQPVLNFGPVDTGYSDIECQFGASLAFVRQLPFQLSFSLPEQKLEKLQITSKGSLEIDSVAGQGRFQGLLRIPQTWKGQALVQGNGFDVRYDSDEMRFDRGRAYFACTTGAISCLDARLIGDKASLLGNATLLSDRRMAGVARIVSTPEHLSSVSESLREDPKALSLTPLSTPQRSALDMQVFGHLGKRLLYKSDPQAKPVELRIPLSPD